MRTEKTSTGFESIAYLGQGVTRISLIGFGEDRDTAMRRCFMKIHDFLSVPKEVMCHDCNDTGEVDDFFFDEGSKEWILDGSKKCHCQYNPE